MNRERLENYKKYLELKGYKPSSQRGLLKRAESYETREESPTTFLKKNTRKLYYYQKKVYIDYLSKIEGEQPYLQEEYHKKEKAPIDILSPEEIQTLFNSCKDTREKVVIVCLYSLGLRLGEVSHIELGDIDRDNKLLLIRKSKTNKPRQVPISSRSLAHLVHYVDHERIHKGNKLLQGNKGNLTADGIYQILKKIAKRTTLKKRVYPHLLRHSIASHLLQRGMDIEQIGNFLGHSSLSSTEIYTHIPRASKE